MRRHLAAAVAADREQGEPLGRGRVVERVEARDGEVEQSAEQPVDEIRLRARGLQPGDAVFFPGGMNEVPRPEADGVLVLVRLSIVNAAGLVPSQEAAAPEAAAPDAAAEPDAAAPDAERRVAVGALAADVAVPEMEPEQITVRRAVGGADAHTVAGLLDDFNREFETPTPGPAVLAQRLEEAGVAVAQMTYPSVTHEFFGMGAVVPQARDAMGMATGALTEALAAQ